MKTKIREFILRKLLEHPNDITTFASKKFNVTRQTIFNNLKKLSDEGLVIASGKTRARKYELKTLFKKEYYERTCTVLAEDAVWRDKILPNLSEIKPNVIEICQYGFTEIVRNVFDHSQSESFIHGVAQNAICIELWVFDHGVGIFNKIKEDFNLSDVRHALLELSKGKLTSDPKRHSEREYFLLLACLTNSIFFLIHFIIVVKVKMMNG